MNDENTILSNIGRCIYEARKSKGITQDDLAFRAGIDRTYVGYIENGKQNITIGMLCKIADALEVSIIELIKL